MQAGAVTRDRRGQRSGDSAAASLAALRAPPSSPFRFVSGNDEKGEFKQRAARPRASVCRLPERSVCTLSAAELYPGREKRRS